MLVLAYGLIFLLAHVPNLIEKKYFNHEARVKILIKSIDYINQVYIESTPREQKDLENSLRKLSATLNQDKANYECKNKFPLYKIRSNISTYVIFLLTKN